MDMKLYVVTECGTICNNMFSLQSGVYSTLEKAQKRMNDIFTKTMKSLDADEDFSIVSYEQDPMETTILFRHIGTNDLHKHFVEIDERTLDEDYVEKIYLENNE